jgi:CheY-like chemotaxis protein
VAVILIVEDDVLIREVAELLVDDLGHSTLSSGDMVEALQLLRSSRHIDALFTDIRLKSATLGGCELARQAIELRPQLRVLYTTGSALTEKMAALFVEGAYFLEKPYSEQQLQRSVEEMLAPVF